MKKHSSKKIKIKLPKKKRFHRFFLRRLLICTLAAMIGGAVLLQHTYLKDAENYASGCSDVWDWNIKRLQNDDDENITIDEKNIQTELSKIATLTDIVTGSPAPFADRAAILIDAENLKFYVSQPEVRFFFYDAKNAEYPNEKRKQRNIIADPELSDQIETELRNYAKEHYPRYYLLGFCYGLLPHTSVVDASSHPVWDALRYFFISRIYSEPIPVAIYLANDKICGAEYGYIYHESESSERTIPFVFRQETEQQEGVQELRNSAVSLRDGQYVYQYIENDADQPDEAYLYHWNLFGTPQNTESGRAMAMTAQKMENMRGMYLHAQVEYHAILADKSGKKRNEYYKEEAKRISDKYKRLGWDADAMRNYNEEMKNIASPEKALEQLNQEFCEIPADSHFYSNTKFTDYNHKFYTCGTKELQINGRTWYLFYYNHKEWLPTNLPYIILYGVAFAIGTILAALIWALIAYFRFKHRYEMDEYRRNLTASLAHDLKSPLMAISSYSENLLNDVQPEKKHHYSKAILENTQYIDNIIVNVLELSRLETHEKTKRKFTDLTALAKELLDGMQEQLDARGLTASVFGGCCVIANYDMMKQALRNLLDNAVKFTPEGGSITVIGEKHSLSIVNDIDEEQINDPQQLSEAFVKGDEARSNRMGTGLGLSIVQQIAAQNKLRLHIDSSMHQFRVKLNQRAPISWKHRYKDKRKAMNLAPLAGEILAAMQKQLDARDLKTAVSGRCIVYAKQEMMRQAIRNLLNNVIQYTPEGSCITVTGEKHTLSIVSDIVEDQLENLQRLCEAFVKGDDADSKRRSADPTIAAVQQIAAQNHIKLRIDSRKLQLRVQLKQNALRSPVCFRKIK